MAYFRDQVLRIGAHLDSMLGFLWPANRRVLDQVVHLVLIRVVKGRYADDHLVDEDAECPPVESFVVSAAHDHLRREILGRAAERVRLLTVSLHNLGQTEVSQHNVAVVVQKNVLWLEIAVDYITLVQVAEGQGDLRGVELGLRLGEALLLR